MHAYSSSPLLTTALLPPADHIKVSLIRQSFLILFLVSDHQEVKVSGGSHNVQSSGTFAVSSGKNVPLLGPRPLILQSPDL